MTHSVFILMLIPTLLAGCANPLLRNDDARICARQALLRNIQSASSYRQIRAAEALGEPRPDFPVDSPDPAVRIGQMRVRVAAGDAAFIRDILAAALDPRAPGHVHALEAAAKLKLKLSDAQMAQLRPLAADHESYASGYALWLLAANDDPSASENLTAILRSTASANRLTAIYAAGFLNPLPPAREESLHLLLRDPDRMTASFALFALARHRKITAAAVRSRLAALPLDAEEKAVRFHLAALGEVGRSADIPLLRAYLTNSEPEWTIAAAGAILHIQKRCR